MRGKSLICLYILLSVFIPCFAWGQIYYVGQSSSGSEDGSTYENRMNVEDHNNYRFQGGDIIYLCGTISSRVIVPSSGSDGNQIVYKGNYNGHYAVLKYNVPEKSAFYISDKDHLVIEGIEIKDGSFGMAIRGDCDDITVIKCKIHNMNRKGLLVQADNWHTNITVGGAPGNGNVIYDVGSDTGGGDIIMSRTRSSIISYNDLHGNGINTGVDGIALEVCDSIIVEYNKIYDHAHTTNAEDGVDLKGSANMTVRYNHIYGHYRQAGININKSDSTDKDCSNVYVYGNRIHDNDWAGVMIKNVSSGVVEVWGNVIFHNEDCGIVSEDDINADVRIYNNTIVNNGYNANGTSHSGIEVTAGDSVVIKNNVVSNNVNTDGKNQQIYVGSTMTGKTTIENNQFFFSGATALIYWGSSGRISASSVGADNKIGDPQFADATNNNFRLQENSPCIDTGVDLGDSYAEGFLPSLTDWSTCPPVVVAANQESYGAWEKGAYIYMISLIPTKPEPPVNLRILDLVVQN